MREGSRLSIERTACRAAAAIERSLASRDAPAPEIPTEGWERVARLAQRLRQTSRWPAAQQTVQRQLSRELVELRRMLDRWEAGWTVPYRASWRDIVDDLLALADSETPFVIDLKGRTLALSTEAVELDGVGGERELPESTLDHLTGYEGASPVRIGNDAFSQRQNLSLIHISEPTRPY